MSCVPGGYGPPPAGRGAPPPPPPFTSYIVSTPPGGFPPPQGFPQGYGAPPQFSKSLGHGKPLLHTFYRLLFTRGGAVCHGSSAWRKGAGWPCGLAHLLALAPCGLMPWALQDFLQRRDLALSRGCPLEWASVPDLCDSRLRELQVLIDFSLCFALWLKIWWLNSQLARKVRALLLPQHLQNKTATVCWDLAPSQKRNPSPKPEWPHVILPA